MNGLEKVQKQTTEFQYTYDQAVSHPSHNSLAGDWFLDRTSGVRALCTLNQGSNQFVYVNIRPRLWRMSPTRQTCLIEATISSQQSVEAGKWLE